MGKMKARKTAGWNLLSEAMRNERNKESEVGKLRQGKKAGENVGTGSENRGLG
jgi:hypothetical protein